MVAYAYYNTDRRIRNYCEALVEANFAVDVVSIGAFNDNKSYVNVEGVNVYRIQNRKFGEAKFLDFALNIFSFLLKSIFLVFKLHLSRKYAVIHVHNVPDLLVLTALFPKIMGARVILDIHDIFPEFFCQKFGKEFKSLSAQVLLLVEKVSMRLADYVIVANHLWLEKIRRRAKISSKKSCAILNYPKLNRFRRVQKKSDSTKFVIIYPGTISRLHGIDIAIRAIKNLVGRIPNVELNIYGKSSSKRYRDEIVNLIRELQLEKQVKIHDTVSWEELNKIYQDVDLGIVPKREGIFSSEAFSTKLFDFFAAGIPVVASQTAIEKFYFNDDIIKFCRPESPDDMANSILELYQNGEKRLALVEEGKRYLKTNNWDIKKTEYIDVIFSLPC
jgi:glycosyltransferase involved in cell wall biosynthesis